jgi:hypothetical protein
MATTENVVATRSAEQLVSPLVTQARSLAIETTDDYENASAFLQLIAERKQKVGEVFDPIVEKAHAAHKEAVAQRNKLLDPLRVIELDVKNKIARFRSDQERKRRAEELRLQEEAHQKAEADALAQAEQLQAAGEPELAGMVIEEAVAAPAPVVVLPSTVPKQDGISGRTNWKYRITDEAVIPREYLSPDPVKIGAVVRAQKSLARIPGIEVYPEESVSVRAK